jgi:hypothetical protein
MNVIVKTGDCPESYDSLFTASNLTVFDLTSRLFEESSKGNNLNYWKAHGTTGHWNHLGHQVVAEFLLKELHPLTTANSRQN